MRVREAPPAYPERILLHGFQLKRAHAVRPAIRRSAHLAAPLLGPRLARGRGGRPAAPTSRTSASRSSGGRRAAGGRWPDTRARACATPASRRARARTTAPGGWGRPTLHSAAPAAAALPRRNKPRWASLIRPGTSNEARIPSQAGGGGRTGVHDRDGAAQPCTRTPWKYFPKRTK